MVAKINSYKLFILSSLVFLTSLLLGGGCGGSCNPELDKYLETEERHYKIDDKETDKLHFQEIYLAEYVIKDVETYIVNEEKKSIELFFKDNTSKKITYSCCDSECCEDSCDDNCCENSCDVESLWEYKSEENGGDNFDFELKNGELHIKETCVSKFIIDNVADAKLTEDSKYLFIQFKDVKCQVFNLKNMEAILTFEQEGEFKSFVDLLASFVK